MSEQGGSNPPAGWYPDPEVPGGTRYWDGSRWGEQRPPTPAPQDPGSGDSGGGSDGGWAPPGGGWSSGGDGWASGGSGGGAPGGAPGGGDLPAWQQAPAAGQGSWSQTSPAADVDPWFWQSIVATFFCCLPLGIVAIVKSSQAKSAKDLGNAQLAQQRAGEARTWTLVTVGVGLVATVLFFTFWVLGASAGI